MIKRRSSKVVLTLAAAALLVLSGCTGRSNAAVQMEHVHGLGFSSDGSQLLVPAHDGFVLYADGQWQVPNLPKNDYMGYAATDDGFYSSGHPGSGSKLPNPLGLVKSTDGGKTLTTLSFLGEIDFHVMGVGYKNHAVYVVNHAATANLTAGLHYSLDDGKTWKQSAARGLSGEPIQIAVHPTQGNVVAVASEGGIFLSSDYGNSFSRIGSVAPVSAVTFTPTGERLLFGLQRLYDYELTTKQVRELQTPAVGEKDAIGYVAVNPAQGSTIALATFGKEIHLSTNGGETWKQIAKQGQGVQDK